LDVVVSADGIRSGDVVKVSLHDGKIISGDAMPDASASVVATAEGKAGEHITLKVPDMKLWSPDSPYLYAMDISIVRGGKAVDAVTGYTAFRKVSVIEDKIGRKRLALNGKPIFMMGPLDQGFWPDGIYTAPTDEAMKYDLLKLKEMGFNMLRKHIKVEPSRYYYYCDQLGLMVWQDMPSLAYGNGTVNKWGRKGYEDGTDFPVTETARAEYYKEWGDIISQLKKFQCIVVWIPFNEAWAQFDTPKAVEFTRAQDPTRLVNAASGGNWSKKDNSDIIDIHHYPEPNAYFWDFSKVNVIGEFGGIGLPVEGHLWQPDHNWGYVQYKDGHDVEKAYTEYLDDLCRLVDFGQSAGVYTQTTDCEIEVNGLMTYDRVLKVDPAVIRTANEKVIARLQQSF
jgi:beta-galactosidase/beta-glucuronidase